MDIFEALRTAGEFGVANPLPLRERTAAAIAGLRARRYLTSDMRGALLELRRSEMEMDSFAGQAPPMAWRLDLVTRCERAEKLLRGGK